MRLTPDSKPARTCCGLLLLLLAMLISGCSGVLSSDQPPRQVYLLQPKSLSATDTTSQQPVELHFELTAIPGLDTDRIIAVDSDARLSGYANARWPDFLPEVLASVMRRSLLTSGQFETVAPPSLVKDDAWSLSIEVQQFFGVQRTRGVTDRVSGQAEAVLTCGEQSRRIPLSASTNVSEERLAVVVRAHQSVLDDMTTQLWDAMQSTCR